MSHYRLFAASILLAAFCACRGTSGPAIPSGAPNDARTAFAAPDAGAVAFKPLGPTHMTSGLMPTAGKTNAYASDPKNPNVIYLASGRGTGLETYSSAGIFRTNERRRILAAARYRAHRYVGHDRFGRQLALDGSDDSSTLLAATEYDGIFRTTNGGTAWRNVYRVDASDAISSRSDRSCMRPLPRACWCRKMTARRGPFRSARSSQQPTALVRFQRTRRYALYAGTTLTGRLEFLQDDVWRIAGKLPYTPAHAHAGSHAGGYQIAVDPREPGTLYASTNDGQWDQNLFVSKTRGKLGLQC